MERRRLPRSSDVWYTMTFANDIRIYEKVIELHETMITDWKAETPDRDFITQLMFQAIPTIFAQHSKERGGNVLGLDDLEENVVMLLFNISVKGADLEVLARAKLRKFGEQIQRYAASLNGLVDWQYLNYADYYQVCSRTYGCKTSTKSNPGSSCELWSKERGEDT
jgi:hypothetical protein